MSTITELPATSSPEPEVSEAQSKSSWLTMAGVIIGVPVVLILMLLAFLVPSLNSGASDLPLAVSGPEAAVSQMTGGLEQKQPGAFDVTTYSTLEEARQSVIDRENIGAISVGADGVSITVASGAGTPYASLLKQLGSGLESTGQTVTCEDVAPLTSEDPTGSSIATLGLPLIFGGNVSAILLITLFTKNPRLRVLGGLAIAVLGGFAVTAVMQFGLGVLDGNYLMTSFVLAMGIASISMTLIGLHNLMGMAGIGIAGVILLFFSNPLSGLATGAAWLPGIWGTIGQLMPIGAAGTAIRSAAFFGGHGYGMSLWVSAIWAIAGILLSVLTGRRAAKKAAQEA